MRWSRGVGNGFNDTNEPALLGVGRLHRRLYGSHDDLLAGSVGIGRLHV